MERFTSAEIVQESRNKAHLMTRILIVAAAAMLILFIALCLLTRTGNARTMLIIAMVCSVVGGWSVMAFWIFSVEPARAEGICSRLGFPAFNLEELLLHWTETITMLFNHEPINAALFVLLGAIIFYIFTFFMEISLARLADTGSMLSSVNLFSIKKSIDIVGWRNYAKDYTLIALAIVILSYLITFNIPNAFIDSIVDMILSFLVFATQYLGIGAAYCEIKDLEYNRTHQMEN